MAGDGCCCLGPECCLLGQGGIASEKMHESSPMDEYQSQVLFNSAVDEDDSSSHLGLMADNDKMPCAASRSDEAGPSHHVADMAADEQVYQNKSAVAEAAEIRNSSLTRIASISESDYDCYLDEIEEPGPSHQVAEMVADAYDELERAIAEAVRQSLVDSMVEVQMGEASAQGLVEADEAKEDADKDEIGVAIEGAVARAFWDYVTEDEIAIASAVQDFMDDDEIAIAEVAAEGLDGERGASTKGLKRKHRGEGSSRSSRSTHGRHV